MHIEDLIISLILSRIPLNQWDSKLISSFYDQITRGSGLTEKQGALAVKILKRHSNALTNTICKDVTPFLENPIYKLSIRKLNNEKKLSITPDDTYGQNIRAVFPFNEELVASIRKYKEDSNTNAFWNKEEKCWIFPLSESAIMFLSSLEGFDTDNTFQNYISQIKEIRDNLENYFPILVMEEGKPVLKNCHRNCPQLVSTGILEAVFEARLRGVSIWDEEIDTYIENDVDSITRDFLKTSPDSKFLVNSDNHSMSVMSTIIKNLSPTIAVIPGGAELTKLSQAVEFFYNCGISNEQMSVMFRLDSADGKEFNCFVKDNQYNAPITEDTKVVFVSSKLPKPVVKSGIKFNSVVNMGYMNVHYTMQQYLDKHANLVYYTKDNHTRNFTIGIM